MFTAQLQKMRSVLCYAPLKERGDKWYFREVDKATETTDSFDRIKLLFKQNPRIYYFLIHIVSPVWSNQKPLKEFLSKSQGLVLNIGSGNEPRKANVINVDMMDYEHVDIVCDIHQLPFKDNSIDVIMSLAVLEHVREPSRVLKEVYRVLKPGATVLSVIPFMQPFHASPHDYQRYTLPGIEFLHRDFDHIESGVFSGPVSGFLWVFQECLASVLSFGVPLLRNLLTIGLMLMTWPVKFLDALFIHLPTAGNVASNYYYMGRKGADKTQNIAAVKTHY